MKSDIFIVMVLGSELIGLIFVGIWLFPFIGGALGFPENSLWGIMGIFSGIGLWFVHLYFLLRGS